MLFYLDSKSTSFQEFCASHGKYIGVLGSSNKEENITPNDISLDKIQDHLKNNEFLVCSILNNSWWIGILFNTPEGAYEIKSKYKKKPILWYWMNREDVLFCLHHIQKKEFENIFPKED